MPLWINLEEPISEKAMFKQITPNPFFVKSYIKNIIINNKPNSFIVLLSLIYNQNRATGPKGVSTRRIREGREAHRRCYGGPAVGVVAAERREREREREREASEDFFFFFLIQNLLFSHNLIQRGFWVRLCENNNL